MTRPFELRAKEVLTSLDNLLSNYDFEYENAGKGFDKDSYEYINQKREIAERLYISLSDLKIALYDAESKCLDLMRTMRKRAGNIETIDNTFEQKDI